MIFDQDQDWQKEKDILSFYLAHTLHKIEGIFHGKIASIASKMPSTTSQRKNLQTLGLLICPIYWIPFLELFLLMMRSFRNVDLKAWSQEQYWNSLQGNGGLTSSICSLSSGSLSLSTPVMRLSSIWVMGPGLSPYTARPAWANLAPTSGVERLRKPTQKAGIQSLSNSSLDVLQLPRMPPFEDLITGIPKQTVGPVIRSCQSVSDYIFLAVDKEIQFWGHSTWGQALGLVELRLQG